MTAYKRDQTGGSPLIPRPEGSGMFTTHSSQQIVRAADAIPVIPQSEYLHSLCRLGDYRSVVSSLAVGWRELSPTCRLGNYRRVAGLPPARRRVTQRHFCLTVKTFPPTVILPLRAWPDWLAATR